MMRLVSHNVLVNDDVAELQTGVVTMIEEAVNSPDMVELLADQVMAFARALDLAPVAGAARAAVVTDISWQCAIPDTIHWNFLRNKFSEYDVQSGAITIDNNMICVLLSLQDAIVTDVAINELKTLLFVKGLHEIGHALTTYCLHILRQICTGAPANKTRKIPEINTPPKAGKMLQGRRIVGDAGSSFEELLTNGLRFTYEFTAQQHSKVHRLTLVDWNGVNGFYLPAQFTSDVIESPGNFYTLSHAYLADHTVLIPISPHTLSTTVIRNAHGSQPPDPPHIKT
ncbi:unnamed protein product (mitochondrion) [Plasmodiophora brassicae]|uniref:Uncharacterized protein n=1 Tax=Plasmodiophora brassicae TaxID=37360 RepID=A0A0G4J4J8_PLABS|nr:hypothetical protein PBRA_008868 [Plasmodiophora brassicae]SPR01678.1 unnamed protein product [Plasmodiophora brassicae]